MRNILIVNVNYIKFTKMMQLTLLMMHLEIGYTGDVVSREPAIYLSMSLLMRFSALGAFLTSSSFSLSIARIDFFACLQIGSRFCFFVSGFRNVSVIFRVILVIAFLILLATASRTFPAKAFSFFG